MVVCAAGLLLVTTLLIRLFLRLARHVQRCVPAAPQAAFGILPLLGCVGAAGPRIYAHTSGANGVCGLEYGRGCCASWRLLRPIPN